MTDEPQHVSPRQEFSSERELIETVKARREQAQAFRAIADEIEVEMGEETDRYNPDLIDGVLVRWINPGRAARDETAFRHALKTAHRLRAAGERMTDAAIIDAYERAYNIAQREGADGRAAEMPPMRDRQTMARCVRGYVTQGKTDSYGTPTAKYATTSQRKALATMGGRGGKKSRPAVGNRPRRGIRPEPAEKTARCQQAKACGGKQYPRTNPGDRFTGFQSNRSSSYVERNRPGAQCVEAHRGLPRRCP